MKTTLKRVLSMALALVLLVGVLPMAALAAETVSTITSVPTFTAHDSAENVVQFVCDDTTHGFKCSSTTCSYEQHKCTENHFDNDCDGKCDFKLTVGAGNDEITYTCGKQFKEAGHTAGSIGATCTAGAPCAVCGKPMTGLNTENHVGGTEVRNAVAATCSNPGNTGEIWCTACNNKVKDGDETPATGNHDFSNNAPVCRNANCDAVNPSYEAPVVVTVNFYVDDELKQTATHEGGEITIQNLINNYCTVDDSVALVYDSAIANNQPAYLTTEILPGQVANVYLKTQTPPNPDNGSGSNSDAGNSSGSGSNSDAGNGSGSGTTTNPTVNYKVYYNLNVDESTTVELGSFPAGTSMATILNQGAIKNAKFPGLFEDWFAVEGWYLNGAKVSANDVNWSLNSNIVLYAKWYQKYNYEVVLKLYTNGNTNNVVKVIDAFKYVQDDGRLSHTEVTNIAKEYIEPNNDAGLTVYGPFDANGWEQYSLYPNRLTNTEYVTVNRNGTTVVHAMVHNAKIYNSTSSTNKKADSSNPKTGDMIMMPAAVMSVSVSALAVMFYLKKKRTV